MPISLGFKPMFILVIIFITFLSLAYLSYHDYKYHYFNKRRYLVLMYPFVFYANYLITKNILITFMGFSFLFLVFYISELLNTKEGIGTMDILSAPLFTVWFNEYSFLYTLIFLALYFTCWIPFVNKNIMNRHKDTRSVALIPVMLVAFLISLILFPNNIATFCGTFWSVL